MGGIGMIEKNIKRLRKQAGMSQEELAIRLTVVRQTVSKWENGLSVPDAEMVIKIAELFHVPVTEILGTKEENNNEDLEQELAEANELLAKKNAQIRTAKLISRKRGLILLFSFLAMLAVLIFENETVSILLTGICIAVAVIILFKNLNLFAENENNANIKIQKITTVFNLTILAICVLASVLCSLGIISISEENEYLIALFVIAAIMIFTGTVSPKLPFSRHTGLRLPWTVRDEDTWNIAHKIMGYISIPVAMLYIGAALTIENFEIVTAIAIITWIGVPSLISLVFYLKKFKSNC